MKNQLLKGMSPKPFDAKRIVKIVNEEQKSETTASIFNKELVAAKGRQPHEYPALNPASLKEAYDRSWAKGKTKGRSEENRKVRLILEDALNNGKSLKEAISMLPRYRDDSKEERERKAILKLEKQQQKILDNFNKSQEKLGKKRVSLEELVNQAKTMKKDIEDAEKNALKTQNS